MNAGEEERDIRQALDRLLLEQGLYSPLEFLLAEGRLLYTDYEAWRGGEGDYLDEQLFGDSRQCGGLLEQAATYAAELKLVSEPLTYTRWGGGEGDRLRFSRDIRLDRLFHTRYCRPAEQPQLDLFMDATGVSLANGVCGSLKERNYPEARRLLQRLFDTDPGHRQLGSLELLIEAAEGLSLPVEEVSSELNYLEQELAPLAGDVLESGSRDYLVPFWQRLFDVMAKAPFDSNQPGLHASYAALKLEAWELVKRSIEKERDWDRHCTLLRRYARACGRLRQYEAAAGCWFLLCWQFPDQADTLGTEAESIWRHRWQRFLGLEPELDNRDFPAWSLLEQPGLVPQLRASRIDSCKAMPPAYLATAELVKAGTAAVPATELIEERRRLKELNPELFVHYLDRYGRG
ncbi:MAG: hypothetical protein GY703_11200 [Gammaproteobacteria bacterium]|nr:hypothetical protein [Gammaproteobacteria bacterium]